MRYKLVNESQIKDYHIVGLGYSKLPPYGDFIITPAGDDSWRLIMALAPDDPISEDWITILTDAYDEGFNAGFQYKEKANAD